MITRFDHAVIAVADLDRAIAAYERLGFEVSPGGTHTGRGTHNAIVRFGLDYFELLGFYDQELATSVNPKSRTMATMFDAGLEGSLGYAVAAADLESEAARWDGTGLEDPLVTRQRRLPDGDVFTWRLFVPGNSAWRQPWPFLIEWDTPDAERLEREAAGSHANGATQVVEIAVLTTDLDATTRLYRQQMGFTVGATVDRPDVAAAGIALHHDGLVVALLAPTGPGAAHDAIDAVGPGLFEIVLAAHDLDAATRSLRDRGVEIEPSAGGNEIRLPEHDACGARIVLRFEQGT